MGLNNQILNDFSRGMDTVSGPQTLPEGMATDVQNWRAFGQGFLEVRGGLARIDVASGVIPDSTAATPNGCFSWRPDIFTQVVLVSSNGDIYSIPMTGTIDFTLRFNSANTAVWCFESMEDSTGAATAWAINGTDPTKKISSSLVVTNMGGTPPAGNMMKSWKNFMTIAGDSTRRSRLYFSALGNPESWTSTDFVDIKSGEDDADPITWLDTIGDDLIVFKAKSTWRISAGPPNPVVRKIANVGCPARFQSAKIEGRLYFNGGNGVYSIDSRNDSLIQPLEYHSGAIEDVYGNGSMWDAKVRMHATTDKRLIVCGDQKAFWEYVPWLNPDDKGNPQGAWFSHSLFVVDLCDVSQGQGQPQTLVSTTAVGGLFKLFEGGTDNGDTIHAVWNSGWLPFSPVEFKERLRRVNVVLLGTLDFILSSPLGDEATFSATKTLSSDNAVQPSMKRWRPEVRARYFTLSIQADGKTTYTNRFDPGSNGKNRRIYSLEFAMRGRKEH